MNLKKITSLLLKVIDKLPMALQQFMFKTITEIRFLKFRIKLEYFIDRNIPNPTKIYWISPKRITLHTNYLKSKGAERLSFTKRVFPPNMRGKVVDGNWDITNWDSLI